MNRCSACARAEAESAGQLGVPIDAVRVGEETEADGEHEQKGHPGATRRARSGRNQDRLTVLVDRLDPAEVGVVCPWEAVRRRLQVGPGAPLALAAHDELDLGRGEDREREPERNRVLQSGREQPEHDEHQPADPGRSLHARSRELVPPSQGREGT